MAAHHLKQGRTVRSTAYPRDKAIWTRFRRLLVVLLLPLPAAAADTLFRVEYQMIVAGLPVGVVTRTLSREDGVYRFQSDAHPTGLMSSFVKKTFHETDRWRVVDGHIRPLGYRYYENTQGESSKTDLIFDWRHRAAWDRARHLMCWPLQDNSQDPASATFAIMAAVARQATEIEIHSIGGRIPVIHHYRVTGRGKFGEGDNAIEVVKIRQEGDARLTLHAWLAPAQAWLPVYLRQEVKGGVDTSLSLTRIEVLDKEALLRIWAE
jgi:hypothetical protein